jgi:hypothetical protein
VIEGEINHGTWTAVDPIVKLVTVASGANSQELPVTSTTGVLALNFKAVLEDNSVKLLQQG